MKRKKGWLPVFLLPAVALFLLIYASRRPSGLRKTT